jgi:fatty-acyl-CoA synthase
VAWVVVRSGAATDEKDLLDFAGAALAKFKVPKRVMFVESIPRSSSDKVRRRVLLSQWTEQSEESGRISS